jgi:hypothetical protein
MKIFLGIWTLAMVFVMAFVSNGNGNDEVKRTSSAMLSDLDTVKVVPESLPRITGQPFSLQEEPWADGPKSDSSALGMEVDKFAILGPEGPKNESSEILLWGKGTNGWAAPGSESRLMPLPVEPRLSATPKDLRPSASLMDLQEKLLERQKPGLRPLPDEPKPK